jgi:hypothetical protein
MTGSIEYDKKEKNNMGKNHPQRDEEIQKTKNSIIINIESQNNLDEIDPRLKRLTILLKESLAKSENNEEQINNKILNLWPGKTLEDIFKDPSFYEKPITQPSLRTQDQYVASLKKKNIPQEVIDTIKLVNVDYRGFDNKIYHGQIDIHKDLAP